MNRDELVLIALDLNLPDILSLCLSNSNYNRHICANNSFWQKKIYKDFGITTTSRTAKEDYQRNLMFRDEIFKASLGSISDGYRLLITKAKEIFNEEYRKVFIYASNETNQVSQVYDYITSFITRFIPNIGENRDNYDMALYDTLSNEIERSLFLE